MTPAERTVLLVDDDPAVRTVLAALVRQAGIEPVEAASAAEALVLLGQGGIDVMVSDLRMPGMDGMELLARATKTWPDVPVVMLTAHGSVSVAVSAMREGARDFLLKPFERDEVLFVIERALLAAGETAPWASPSGASLLGESPAMQALRDAMQRAARSPATVLIRGENGTGKELVARAIHDSSPRRAGPFVKLNCAALPESLLESEIFGYERGAFTGATRQKPGRVELAEGGTLLLDEIGDYSATVQLKLLRILQERELSRLGGSDTFKVDVRFVAATNKNLEALVARGAFREDLFYRLNVLPMDVPPLRERAPDIPTLVQHFAARAGAANDRSGVRVTREAIARLAEQPWPGNVRQLENFVERLVVFSDGTELGLEDVERELARDAARSPAARPDDGRPAESGGFAEARRQAERAAIEDALRRARNNRSLAARMLNMSRRTLYTKLHALGIG